MKDARRSALLLLISFAPCLAPPARGQSRRNATPLQFGAAANAVVLLDGAMTAGSALLAAPKSSPFNCSKDVGKAVAIAGAGERYAGFVNAYRAQIPTALVTTIASCQSKSQVTLAHAAFFTVSGSWTAFGTDDSAAIRNCVNAGTNSGGRCTIATGKQFMVSSAATRISIPSPSINGGVVDGGAIDGGGTIVFAPAGGVTNSNSTLLAIGALSYSPIYQIAAPIAKGAASFTAANSAQAALLAPGQWIVLEENDSSTGTQMYFDWAQVASVSGATVNLTQPTRMLFPDTHAPFSPTNGLGWRSLSQLASKVTIKDIHILVPAIVDPTSGLRVVPILPQFARNLTIENTFCENASQECLGSQYDQGDRLIGNVWDVNANANEIATAVDGVYTGNTFGNRAAAINGYAGPCESGAAAVGALVDLASGFFTFSDNLLPASCQYGLLLETGDHDGTIARNRIGFVAAETGPALRSGITVTGGYRLAIIGNVLSGAQGAPSTGIVTSGQGGSPGILSRGNSILNNHVNEPESATGETGSAARFQADYSIVPDDLLVYQDAATRKQVVRGKGSVGLHSNFTGSKAVGGCIVRVAAGVVVGVTGC